MSIGLNKYTLLWDINKGYRVDIADCGRFAIFYDPEKKICPHCGKRKDQ